MNSPLVVLFAVVCGFTAAIRVPVSYDDTPSPCPGPKPSKVVLCYYDGELSLKKLDPCLCSHLVFTSAATIHPKNYTLNLTTDVGKTTRDLRKRNSDLRVLVSVGGVHVPTDVAEALVKSADRRAVFSASVSRIIKDEELNGIEINFKLDAKGGSRNSKGGLVALAKLLRKEMGVEKSHRSKRDYSVFEEVDDISTTAWTPFSFKPFGGNRGVRRADTGTRTPHRPILRSARTDTDHDSRELLRQSYLALEQHTPKDRLILVNVPTQPEVLVKRYDLKTLSKYVDFFVVPTHNLTDYSESGVTYHPSRLMGLADILNTDSLMDLLTGLGAPHDKLIISIPATATKFTLKDPEQNTPRSPSISEPETITQTQLCALISDGGWTIERDEDLTAPYAFKNDTWLAFDDRISIGIKSKYVLLRDLAGAALYTVDSADWSGSCLEENATDSKAPRLLHSLHHAFTSLARKSRGAVLETLQEDIRTSTLLTFSGDVQLSPYRIVRIVDNLGAVHVVRKDARTEFECSRQGYFRHPLGCNRFYRCVKFNQYSADFTVFEYDCPAGLAFDERWEVCVWPGSLPEGACHGSSEIAPVPRARFACPAVEGYYADPENCRWFFACLDHARDGATPLTAYEFRCPFGLVFDEQNLLCQWPWLVQGCGNIGIYAGSYFGAVGFGSAASRGYVATAEEGYIAGGAAIGSAFGAGSRFAQGSGAAILTGSGAGVGLGSAANRGYVATAEEGYIAGGAAIGSAFGAGSRFAQGSGAAILTGSGAGVGLGSAANRGYVATAEEGYIAGGAAIGSAFGAGSRFAQGSGAAILTGSGAGVGLVSGGATVVKHGSGFSAGYEAGQAGVLQDINSGENVVTGYASGAGRGSIKYANIVTDDGEQFSNSFIAGGKSSQRFDNAGSYNEGRHISSYATFPDSLVSGGRIENSGGVVLEQNIAVQGVGTGFGARSGGSTVIAAGQGSGFVGTAAAHTKAVNFAGGVVPVQAAVPIGTFEKTVYGNIGGAGSAIPVQAPVPIETYGKTVYGNVGSGISAVPVQTAVPVQAAVPVATYEKTIHGNIGSVIPAEPVQTAVPFKAAVPVQSAVPVQAAVPVATYEKTIHGNIGGSASVVPAEASISVTDFRKKIAHIPLRKPVVQVPAVQPLAQGVPVTESYHIIVKTPTAPVTTYRRPAVANIPQVQPLAVPAPVPAVVQTPQVPVVPVSRLRKPSFESATPVLPVVEQAALVVPAVSQTVIPQIRVNSAPVVVPISRRTKLRPVTYQTVSTPAPSIVSLQNEFTQVTGSGHVAGGAYTLRERPGVFVVNEGAAGISVPVSKLNVQTGGAVLSGTTVPVTPVPAVNTVGYSPAPAVVHNSFVSSTANPAVVSGGFVSSTPAPTVVSGGSIAGYTSGGYVSNPSPVVLTGSVIQNVPAAKSSLVTGGYSYSTPITAVFTGGPSVTPSLRPKSRLPIGRFSYSTPAPQVYTATPASAIVTGSTVSVTPAPIKTQSLPVGGNVPILRAGLAPAIGYTQPQISRISLSSGLRPALYENSPNLATGLEIPSSTVRPAFVGSENLGASGLKFVSTSNIQIGNAQGNGYISTVAPVPVVSISNGVPLTKSYSRGQGAILSSTVAPIQPAQINTGGFRARTSYQGRAGTFISAFPGAVSVTVGNERSIPVINEKSQSYLSPATVYSTAAPLVDYSTVRARGRARPYNDQVTGFVSSTPFPEISKTHAFYSSTPRPTFYQVVTTPKPVTYITPTPAPRVTNAYLSPKVSIETVTSVPLVRTSTLGSQVVDGFSSRASGTGSGRKTSLRTQINYDNENVEALLDKYSGKFGGLLDNNKEGFVSGVITDDLVGRGRTSQGAQGSSALRGRVSVKGGYSTTTGYSDGGSSTVFGSRTTYSTQPSVDTGSSTLRTLDYTRSRGGFSTTVSPDIFSTTVGTGLRGKVRYGPAGNIDADGGIGYEAVTVGYDGIKSKSKDNPVVVITRLSDVNPLLVAKLGAQCTCKSNTVTLKRPQGYSRDSPSGVKSTDDSFLDDILSRSGTFGIPEHVPSAPLPGSQLVTGSSPDLTLGLGDGFSSTTPVSFAPVSVTTPKSAVFLKAVGFDNPGITPASTVLVTSARPRVRPGVTYAAAPSLVDVSSPTPFVTSLRSRAEPQTVSAPVVPLVEVNSVPRSRTRPVIISTTAVPVVPVVTSRPYSLRTGPTEGDVAGADLDAAARAGIGAGRSFDRYGPGGWRGIDETLQGSVDCKRAGLFRHPKYCNKFYACHWDEWKGRFTLHVFNCPVHLAYDTNLGACNWPSKGPSCTDDNLLV